MEYAKILNDSEIKEIHESSLWILENVGIKVRNEEAREIFTKAGCKLQDDGLTVKFPVSLVEEQIKNFVPKFTFRGRNPDYDITLPDDRPCVVTGSSAPDIVDPGTGIRRRSTSKDIANIAHLINELKGYDVFSISTLADDAPKGQFSISRFYPALKNCEKPVRSNTPSLKELQDVLELGEIIAGGKEAYRERPIINHHYCPVISPLTMDIDSTSCVIYLVKEGLPVYGTIVPNAGISGPMTLAGTVAIGNAEFLALATLFQIIRPGTPLIYAVLSTVADMRTGAYTPGAIETGILQIAHTQMAMYYNVPSGGYIGLTNSHINDSQSGYETGMNTTAALMGGADLFNMGGLLGSLMAFDFSKAVIDNEIALMLKRLAKGIEVEKESIALDLIAEVGPGGSFMDSMHTLQHMKDQVLFTEVSERDMFQIWEKKGKTDAAFKALEITKNILSKENPVSFSEEVDKKLRERFKGLVEGKGGWYY